MFDFIDEYLEEKAQERAFYEGWEQAEEDISCEALDISYNQGYEESMRQMGFD